MIWKVRAGVGCEIAPFGVAGYHKASFRKFLHDMLQVAGCALLSWNMVHIGHVEVFLPADQGVIRPSENDQNTYPD